MLLAWLYFAFAELTQFFFAVVGWIILLPFCVFHSWEPSPIPSINPVTPRCIDQWKWKPLNYIYGNPEDGVSGKCAVVWGGGADAGKLVPYWPTAPDWLRAYAWCAWRNSSDNLKYVFAWKKPLPVPFVSGSVTLFGKKFNYDFGWKLENGKYYVPVFGFKPS